MKRLTDNVTSGYIEAMNRLRPKGGRRKIIAYVESYDDVAFWRLLLDEFESDSLYFQIMLPDGKSLTRGKKSAMSKIIDGNSLGSYMIACVDSDYDYLMQGRTESSAQMLSNPYVIQTYAYAIESYQCYAGSLHQVCVQSTLNDHRLIDFEAFMETYSRIIFPLFTWNILFYRERMHNLFSMQDMFRVIRLDTVSVKSPHVALRLLSERVEKKVAWLEKSFPLFVDQIPDLAEELHDLGVTEESTYLFIQGHNLVENLVNRLLEPVCTVLVRERESEIQKGAVHREQLQNELRSYEHSQIPIDEALRKNTHYRNCRPYHMMRDRAQEVIDRISSSSRMTEKAE